ncbi:hypothetical protein PR202_gb04901 [Eleusine coracana subsp. coracana]|uniref:K-box domain-containing protein n=1 Tax=Eleusine coracana subsp. coracana TaxID=191504 RepID=A0AAV5E375_ELECO|nr:hypothetical protein PR202_gb04901 [Eleusine coracana subsp. coracana]
MCLTHQCWFHAFWDLLLFGGGCSCIAWQERRAELEQVNQMCELLERELRFMTVDEREQHTVPSLELLERNLEAAMYKVRCEKERKIGGEINYLENIIRGRQEERYGLCDKVSKDNPSSAASIIRFLVCKSRNILNEFLMTLDTDI